MKKIVAALLVFTMFLSISLPVTASEIEPSTPLPQTESSPPDTSSVSSEITSDSQSDTQNSVSEDARQDESSESDNGNTSIQDDFSDESDSLDDDIQPRALPFTYKVNNNQIQITSYTGTDTDVTIPSSINGIPVTSFTRTVFSGSKTITSVILPDSIKEIPDFAFWKCTNLQSITFPSTLTSIGKSAFLNCSSLASISLPSTLTDIYGTAFMGCSLLSSISLPSQLASIGNSAFQDCTQLTYIFIPESVTTLGEKVFYNCTSLESASFPDHLTTIPYSTFNKCSSLTSVSLPASLEVIEYAAFADCSSLVSIEIPGSVTTIEEFAFSGNTSLTSITIPSSVNTLEIDIFDESNLVTIYCYKDSAAYQYALDKNIPYVLLDVPVDDTTDTSKATFIKRIYTSALGRSPDQSEIDLWVNSMENGSTTGTSFVFFVFSSDEFILANHSNRSFIILLYNAAFGREPDLGGLGSWLSPLDNFNLSRATLSERFLSSDEFAFNCNKYNVPFGTIQPQDLQNTNTREFVVYLYKNLFLRSPDIGGLNYWYDELRNQKISPYQLTYGFVFCDEVLIRTQSDEEYVTMLYNSFLQRAPDGSNYNTYVRNLKKGVVSRPQLLQEFFNSAEFQHILLSFGV